MLLVMIMMTTTMMIVLLLFVVIDVGDDEMMMVMMSLLLMLLPLFIMTMSDINCDVIIANCDNDDNIWHVYCVLTRILAHHLN